MAVITKTWLTKNKALVDVGVYYVLTFVNQAVPFLILPLITLYLQPRDFGFINTFSALLLIATSLANGFQVTINKNFYAKNEAYNRVLIGNLYLLLGLLTAFFALLALAAVFFGNVRVLPAPCLLLIPLVAFFYVSLEFLKTIFKMAKKTLAFAMLTFSEVFVNVALTLVLVIGFSWHWQGRVAGIIFTTVLFGLFALVFMINNGQVRFSFDRAAIRDILKVTLPLIPWGFSVMLMRRSGVLFIDASFGKTEAGLYGVAMNLATVILFLAVPVINVWTPFLYEKLARRAGPAALAPLYHKLLLIAGGALLLTLIFALFSRHILAAMTTEAFAGAGRFIPWLAFGFCMWALTALLTPFLVHFNRQKLIALIATGSAALNLALNVVLIRRWGPSGAAASFFVANALSALIMLAVVRRMGRLPLLPDARQLWIEARDVFK